jgi:hypothetical protein
MLSVALVTGYSMQSDAQTKSGSQCKTGTTKHITKHSSSGRSDLALKGKSRSHCVCRNGQGSAGTGMMRTGTYTGRRRISGGSFSGSDTSFQGSGSRSRDRRLNNGSVDTMNQDYRNNQDYRRNNDLNNGKINGTNGTMNNGTNGTNGTMNNGTNGTQNNGSQNNSNYPNRR